MRVRVLLLIALLGSGLGCVRHIATPSEIARSQNDIDWRIEREPQVPSPPGRPPAEPVEP
jgi:hypothetical protein